MMPDDDFNSLKDHLKASGQSCDHDPDYDDMFYCSCMTQSYGSFPDLELLISNNIADVKSYKIPSTSYLEHKGLKCYFKIQSHGPYAGA